MKAHLLFALISAYLPYATAADAPTGRAAFPVVDPATQKARDETRRQILEEEQATERARLNKVKAELATAEGANRPQSEVLALRESRHRHETNLVSLNQELLRMDQQGSSRPNKVVAVKSAAPVQLKSVEENQPLGTTPAPYWDVYRRQANNRLEREIKSKMQLSAN